MTLALVDDEWAPRLKTEGARVYDEGEQIQAQVFQNSNFLKIAAVWRNVEIIITEPLKK